MRCISPSTENSFLLSSSYLRFLHLFLSQMASESEKLHFVLFPLTAQGHMIPMIDIARLLAQQGVIITIITTPINANRFRKILNRDLESGLPINLVELKFPAESAGLPADCENLDMLSSLGLTIDFYSAFNLLQDPVETLLQQMNPSPNCIISDMNLPYTSRVATKLLLPRISFVGFSCLSMLFMDRVYNSGILETINSDSEYFSIPGLPPHLQFTKRQLVGAVIQNGDAFASEVAAAEKVTYGLIINSFEDLESEFIQQYKKLQDKKVWCIGPVSLINDKHNLDRIQRGDSTSTEKSDECLKWLDEQQSGSVIYVCFGSLCNLVTSQLIELALGLEASNRSFIWVLRGGEKSRELEKWIEEEGFEERTKGRSFIIRGWAPQLVILSHVAIGGFLTHCGWNSTLEAMSAGVPMITWPLFGDQFCNEKLIVDVLQIGVKVGAKVTVVWGHEDKIGVVVKKEDVTKAILELTEVGEESEERKRRVKDLSVKAKKALEEYGSSYLNLKLLIEDIRMLAANKGLA
ncbi:UDP-glycosyltransferase 73C1-like [Euphorbia lathyris]|uniref:UDP-glycosyltransferase 73C1-like n=1 Tax=Euphorbia lathyris TaxID=212925 RepID=UPI003313E3B9